MPLSVVLETESGEDLGRIDDPSNVFHCLLPREDDRSSSYLRFIDWYGDTVFNRLQMEPFLAEWEQLQRAAKTSEEKALLAQVITLARRCQQEPHLYLKFYGD